MRIIISSYLALLIPTLVAVQGWVLQPQKPAISTVFRKQHQTIPFIVAPLYSTTADETSVVVVAEEEAATASDSDGLLPEYSMAYEMILQTIQSKVPEALKKSSMIPLLNHFAKEYMIACQNAEVAKRAGTTISSEAALTDPKSSATRFLTGVQYGLQYGLPSSPDLYTFNVSHVALDGTQDTYNGVDYYSFGCNFFRPVMNLQSIEQNCGGDSTIQSLQQIQQQLQNGENVILFANHQSEADPQVVSACLELAGYGTMAKDMIYVAGHKVTTDPLAIPFSMGRNLICIHSKKHIDSDPETKPMKQKQNLMAMNALLSSLKEDSGSIIWVAPSGGRDRRNVETGEVPIAPFDSKTIDMFRLMGNKSKKPTHYYTMAMVSYDLCPPPDNIVAGVGEVRNVRFCPVGIKIGYPELMSVGGLESRQSFCHDAEEQCNTNYHILQDLLFPSATKEE